MNITSKITLIVILFFIKMAFNATAQPSFTWLDKGEYPFHSRYFPVNGQQLHYIDEGEGEILLFVHGTPTWSFDFRKIIRGLASDYRCIAVDHIGFGLSTKPKEYDYSTLNHSNTLEKFILANDLTNITLVVHDFGGPIGLNVAITHPDRVKRLVVLNSWLWSSEQEPEYIRYSKFLKSPLLPFLYKHLNFSPRVLLPKSYVAHKPGKSILRQYRKPFANAGERNGTLAFAHSLLHDQDWFESLWAAKDVIANKPTLFLWGMKDPVIPPKNLAKFQSGFPFSITVELAECGHYPQEEESLSMIMALRSFME